MTVDDTWCKRCLWGDGVTCCREADDDGGWSEGQRDDYALDAARARREDES